MSLPEPNTERARLMGQILAGGIVAILLVYGGAFQFAGISASIYLILLLGVLYLLVFRLMPKYRKAWLQEIADKKSGEKEKFKEWMREHEAEKAASDNSPSEPTSKD